MDAGGTRQKDLMKQESSSEFTVCGLCKGIATHAGNESTPLVRCKHRAVTTLPL